MTIEVLVTMESASSVAPRALAAMAPSRPSPWLRGPVWDGFWMQSALWLVPVVVWLSRRSGDARLGPVDSLYFGLTALFWIGHRLCSTYLAYCTEAYRPLLRTQPTRFVVLPLLVTAGCFAILLPPDGALPWSRAERLVALAIVDYLFVTYHFAAQHFGALAIYRARAGRSADARARTIDRLFALVVGGVMVFLADLLAGSVAYQDRWLGRFTVSGWLVSAQDPIRAGAVVVVLAATAAMLVTELRAPRWSLPRLLYVLGIAAMVVLAFRPRDPFLFVVIWTSQHWILATGLASRTPVAESAPAHGRLRRALHGLNTRPWALLLLLVAISVLLLPLFEVEAVRVPGEAHYGDRLFGAFATALRTSTWVPALLALGFATGFVHYLLDRSVYRLSNPEVRAAARGLLARDAPSGS
jgi:hypothetical protein